MLQQFAAKYSPKDHLDVIGLPLESLATQDREPMSLADATTILEINQNNVIQNEVEGGSVNNFSGPLVDKITSAVDSTCKSD
eukprot:15337312-Ditylum_brightwellii.AAC.1